jgi:hypothetical protein
MESAAIEIFKPVFESAIVLAGHYAKACNRNSVTSQDVQYGFRYAARHVTGKQVGSLFPEIYDDSGSDSDSDELGDEDEIFTRYEGDDDMCMKMNECYDTWGAWQPETPAEQSLKNSIDKIDAKD